MAFLPAEAGRGDTIATHEGATIKRLKQRIEKSGNARLIIGVDPPAEA